MRFSLDGILVSSLCVLLPIGTKGFHFMFSTLQNGSRRMRNERTDKTLNRFLVPDCEFLIEINDSASRAAPISITIDE